MPIPENVTEACHGARIVLTSWSVPEDTAETITLVVSELATNAIRHARCPGRTVDVALIYDSAKTIEIEVADGSPHHPIRKPYGPDATSGRGLLLIEALSDAWEVREREFGKAVWVRVLSS
ncbi:ATP-binding protein [Streptomyces blattellae]|uniref:ATP-binding protein n=1 Tax=Streptomyces blattellae TaxID=2569855 RepID=UPI0012B85EA8|nr:ATP-binding protein [Streptomyces blattellae]